MMGYLASAGDHSLPTLRRALGFGTVVASFNIEDFSLGRLKTITRQQIDERFEAYAGMLDV